MPILPDKTSAKTLDLRHESRASCNQDEETQLDQPASKAKPALFAKALMKDMIQLLPLLPETDSLEEIRDFLRQNLHYNSVKTRERFTSYILKHAFPGGKPDKAFCMFARKYPDTIALRDVCLYRLMQSQPLVSQFVVEAILPALGQGSISRSRLQQFLTYHYPSSNENSLKSTALAIIEALSTSRLVKVDKTSIRFGVRDVSVEAFAFILHSELPESQMHSFSTLNSNIYKEFLWDTQALVPALYELRNRGLIAKISEIDGIRQFTTHYTLEQLVYALQPK